MCSPPTHEDIWKSIDKRYLRVGARSGRPKAQNPEFIQKENILQCAVVLVSNPTEHICTCFVEGNDDRRNNTCRVFSDFGKHFDAHRRAPQLPNARELSATGTAHSGLNIHKLRLL